MIKSIHSHKAAEPFSQYSQAVEVPANARFLTISGQAGVSASGELAASSVKQNEVVWQNIFAILDAAKMDKTDIIEIWAMVTDHDEVINYRDVRDKVLCGHMCASTILVCGLANPNWKVEIAVKAAKVDE